MKYTTFIFLQIAMFKGFEIGNVSAKWWQILLGYIICYVIEKTDFTNLGKKFAEWAYMAKIRKEIRKEKRAANKIINDYKNGKDVN